MRTLIWLGHSGTTRTNEILTWAFESNLSLVYLYTTFLSVSGWSPHQWRWQRLNKGIRPRGNQKHKSDERGKTKSPLLLPWDHGQRRWSPRSPAMTALGQGQRLLWSTTTLMTIWEKKGEPNEKKGTPAFVSGLGFRKEKENGRGEWSREAERVFWFFFFPFYIVIYFYI